MTERKANDSRPASLGEAQALLSLIRLNEMKNRTALELFESVAGEVEFTAPGELSMEAAVSVWHDIVHRLFLNHSKAALTCSDPSRYSEV